VSEASRRRAWQLGAVVLFAAIVVTVLVLVLNASTTVDLSGLPRQAKEVENVFGGISQQGTEIGEARAPATLVEFADPQCPFCGQFARDVLPEVIRRYVRTGRLRMRLEVLTFLGPDSQRIGGLIAGASLQDRAWQLSELAYENQGDEGSAYATDEYLRKIAGATPGLDAPEALAAAERPPAQAVLEGASREASRLSVESTPTFYVLRRGRAPEEVPVSELTFESFQSALDPLLRPR
jgi:protein-disulfide isomerase